MKEIGTDPGALALPVKPYSPCAVMEVIVSDDHVYGCMQFDAAYLCTCKITFVIDVMYMIVFYDREYTAQIADYAVFAAVVYHVVANYVTARGFFAPTFKHGGKNHLVLIAVAGLFAQL